MLTNGSVSTVIEPTCGKGSFLKAADETFPDSRLVGLEVNPDHVKEAHRSVPNAEVHEANIFDFELGGIKVDRKTQSERLLVIGNPPWVTNSEQGAIETTNLPHKHNIGRLQGMEAKTGSANFDIAESIILKLITSYNDDGAIVAMLCKTSVARNLLQHCRRLDTGISRAWIFRIDAKSWFNAAVDACFFVLDTGSSADSATFECPVYETLSLERGPTDIYGFVEDRLVRNVTVVNELSKMLNGSPINWRQGLKHDAAAVMELTKVDSGWQNKYGEWVEVEEGFVFPLAKGTSLSRGNVDGKTRVVVPQRQLGEDTRALQLAAPKLWAYLESHRKAMDGRKSSIYNGKPPFSIFGIGDYSFSPYKVAVSGLHKEPVFRVLEPIDDRPVMVDDTCYMLPFYTKEAAESVAASLNNGDIKRLLTALSFPDAKRPITKSILQRLTFEYEQPKSAQLALAIA